MATGDLSRPEDLRGLELPPWRPDSQARPSGWACRPWGSRVQLPRGSGVGPPSWPPSPGAEGQPYLTCAGLALVAGGWEPSGPSQVVDLGGLAAFLTLCPYPGQKCAMAILFLVPTRRVLCSPCHFNARVAPGQKGKGVGTNFRPLKEPPAHSSCPACALRASSSIRLPSPFCPLPCPPLTAQSPQSCPVPAVNLYLLHRPLLAPDPGLVCMFWTRSVCPSGPLDKLHHPCSPLPSPYLSGDLSLPQSPLVARTVEHSRLNLFPPQHSEAETYLPWDTGLEPIGSFCWTQMARPGHSPCELSV